MIGRHKWQALKGTIKAIGYDRWSRETTYQATTTCERRCGTPDQVRTVTGWDLENKLNGRAI